MTKIHLSEYVDAPAHIRTTTPVEEGVAATDQGVDQCQARDLPEQEEVVSQVETTAMVSQVETTAMEVAQEKTTALPEDQQ